MGIKNNYLQQLQNAALKGRQEGIFLGLDICAIALNEEFGFGEKRLQVLEQAVQKMIDEIGTYKDSEKLAVHLAKRLAQIRKNDADFFQRRYINL